MSVKIIQANIAGINLNPWEYDNGSVLETLANERMEINEKWVLSNDRKTKDRFSILYNPTIPLNLTDEAFKYNWHGLWNEKYGDLDKQNLMEFDLNAYKAISSVYEKNDIEEMFRKPFVDKETKSDMIFNYLSDEIFDHTEIIIMLQEILVTEITELCKDLQDAYPTREFQFFVNEPKTKEELVRTMIITCGVSASIFGFPNINFETVAVKIKGGSLDGYVVVASHYSARDYDSPDKESYQTNHRKMLYGLDVLDKYIVGVDANHELNHTFGDTNRLPTSIKKRTKLQAQFDKIKQVSKRIDYIFHKGPLNGKWDCVFDLYSLSNDPRSLPNDNLPFDHAVRTLTLSRSYTDILYDYLPDHDTISYYLPIALIIYGLYGCIYSSAVWR